LAGRAAQRHDGLEPGDAASGDYDVDRRTAPVSSTGAVRCAARGFEAHRLRQLATGATPRGACAGPSAVRLRANGIAPSPSVRTRKPMPVSSSATPITIAKV